MSEKYMGTIDNILMSDIVSQLYIEGYQVEEVVVSENAITGISLDNSSISISANGTATIKVTYEGSSEGKLYYTVVEGKYYKITLTDLGVTIDRTPSQIDGTSRPETLTASSDDESYVTVGSIIGNEITLNAGNISGTTIITVSYGSYSETCEISVVIKPAEGNKLDFGDYSFDNDFETYDTVINETKWINIDKEQWGEKIQIKLETKYGRDENSTSIYFYDTDGQKIEDIGMYFYKEGGTTITDIYEYTIPENCGYIEFWAGDGDYKPYIYVYEIQIGLNVDIVMKSTLEPIIKGDSIEQNQETQEAIVELIAAKNVKKAMYKLNEEQEWKEYTGEIKISNDIQVIYAKGIGTNGEECMKVTTMNFSKTIIDENAYDNDTDTYFEIKVGQTAILRVDSTAYGKTININLKTKYGRDENSTAIYFYDTEGNKIENIGKYFYIAGGSTTTNTYSYTIPENCGYVEFWVGSGTSTFTPYMYIYEITVE